MPVDLRTLREKAEEDEYLLRFRCANPLRNPSMTDWWISRAMIALAARHSPTPYVRFVMGFMREFGLGGANHYHEFGDYSFDALNLPWWNSDPIAKAWRHG